jgi:putative transposase
MPICCARSGFTAHRLMELAVAGLTGAGHGERSPERLNYRNWLPPARLGEARRHRRTAHFQAQEGLLFPGVSRAAPDGREGADRGHSESRHPGRLDPRGRRPGPSDGDERHLEEPSQPAVRGDRRQDRGLLNRPLEGDWPYLWLDATYVKGRMGGRIVSTAVIVAVAVNGDGRREVLGIDIGPSEAETFWTEFLRKLAWRGLRGVKLVVSDAHEELKAAVARVLHASWQRCRVHFMRNVLVHAGKSGRRVVAAFIGTAFAQEDAETARTPWRQVADQLRPKVPKLAALMDEAEADVLAYMSFPKDHRAKIHSTNPLERLNGEIKRRTEVVGIFPNEAAITRLVGAILLEQNDKWAVQRSRYMTLENDRAVERRSDRQAARCGCLTLSASPAGEREITALLHHHRGTIQLHRAKERFDPLEVCFAGEGRQGSDRLGLCPVGRCLGKTADRGEPAQPVERIQPSNGRSAHRAKRQEIRGEYRRASRQRLGDRQAVTFRKGRHQNGASIVDQALQGRRRQPRRLDDMVANPWTPLQQIESILVFPSTRPDDDQLRGGGSQ